jgi:integrase
MNDIAESHWHDFSRRRLQLKGHLYRQGGYWKLRWREDKAGPDGALRRVWSAPVWIGPCEGPKALTERQARRFAWDNVLSKIDANNQTPASVITLGEFVQRKFRPEHIANLKTSGKIHYESCLKHILPALGHLRLRDISVSAAQKFISELMVNNGTSGERLPASWQTRKHMRNALSAIFEHALRIDWFAGKNPAPYVKLPAMKRRPTHALTPAQVAALLELLPSTAREMVLTAVLTSMNVAEICGLCWRHVNLTDKWATVESESLPPRSLIVLQQFRLGEYTSLKTTNRQRVIALPSTLVGMFSHMKASDADPDAPVFAARETLGRIRPVQEHNTMRRIIKPAATELGMPWIGWHSFRRTTATLADQAGLDTSDRKALLGHSSAAMATHYVQGPSLERQRATLDEIAAMLFRTSERPERA